MTVKDIWSRLLTDRRLRDGYIEKVSRTNKNINAFVEFKPEETVRNPSGRFAGIPFAVKDNIAARGFHCTCGSRFLTNYVSSFNATAVDRLLAEGALIAGKTNLDEFGMGSSTEFSVFGAASNPWDTGRVAGGSSGGSAAAVAAGFVPFALGSDTGGSVRQPASFCGVYGLKPTYGSVSRYGLVAYASSLEVIGVLAGEIEVLKSVFECIRGHDPMDQTSVDHPAAANDDPVRKVGILDCGPGLHPAVAEVCRETEKALRSSGYEIVPLNLPVLKYAVPVYYTIAVAEASANLERYNGVRYGVRSTDAADYESLVRHSRDAGFGDEVKLRIMLGTYVLRSGFQDRFYHRAQKIRTAIRHSVKESLKNVDIILMPVFPTPPFRKGGVELTPFQQKLADQYTVTANLTGMPACSFPVAVKDGLPVGMQVTASHFQENRLFNVMTALREHFDPPRCPAALEWED